MPWDQSRLNNLRSILAELYPREADQRRFIKEADVGLDAGEIGFDQAANTSWYAILRYANDRNKVGALVAFAREGYPDNDLLERAASRQGPPAILTGPEGQTGLTWQGPANTGPLLEKIVGDKSTLVPVSFLALGLRRARAVARVQRADGAVGSGFLTADNILITNNHVLPDMISAASATARFNYQQHVDGLDEPAEDFNLAPDDYFHTSKEDDFSAVRVKGDPEAKWGALDLGNAGKLQKEDRVNIIQHPGGGYKQISFYSNVVVFVGQRRVQYLTDTLPGSSGAPVFDRDWNVIALHHAGGWLTEPGGDPKQTFYRNEGVLIDAVAQGLESDPPPLRKGPLHWDHLTIPPLREALARLYDTIDESKRVVADAGIDPVGIRFDNEARANWGNILDKAKQVGAVDAVIRIAQKEYQGNDRLEEVILRARARRPEAPTPKAPPVSTGRQSPPPPKEQEPDPGF